MHARRALIAAGSAAVAAGALLALPLGSGAETAATLQQKIARTQSAINAKRSREHVLTTDITGYSRRINALQSDITRLQRRQNTLQGDLDERRAQLLATQEELRIERARLARLQARLATGRRVLAARLVSLYKAGEPDIVTVILQSDGFADLLERGEFIRRVGDQDQRIITRVRTAKAEATATARRLDRLEARQQRLTNLVLRRRDEVAQVKSGLVDRRAGYASARSGKQALLASARASRAELQHHLDSLQADVARITSRLQGSPGNVPAGPIRRGGGQFIWPVNGPITSPFCERRAWESCHPGIDIGVGAGTPIRAAGSGRVAIAGWEGGYGNYTCIQHGGALSTCYAHQSRIGVSVGQSVSQGQVIGAVGCTGRCYGAHLHFEVRVNGSVVNPLNYL